ncbi:MAG: hypothetical protein OXU42_18495 [Deltaproteobacteria bacterium]|nr:hypothetical protein [Deltaproteobacteria bacterium]
MLPQKRDGDDGAPQRVGVAQGLGPGNAQTVDAGQLEQARGGLQDSQPDEQEQRQPLDVRNPAHQVDTDPEHDGAQEEQHAGSGEGTGMVHPHAGGDGPAGVEDGGGEGYEFGTHGIERPSVLAVARREKRLQGRLVGVRLIRSS